MFVIKDFFSLLAVKLYQFIISYFYTCKKHSCLTAKIRKKSFIGSSTDEWETSGKSSSEQNKKFLDYLEREEDGHFIRLVVVVVAVAVVVVVVVVGIFCIV